jgi:hypothetical protein
MQGQPGQSAAGNRNQREQTTTGQSERNLNQAPSAAQTGCNASQGQAQQSAYGSGGMGIGVDAHEAAEPQGRFMPEPVKIEPPRLCVDLDRDAVLGTCRSHLLNVDVVAGRRSNCRPPEDRRIGIGHRGDDAIGLRCAVPLETAALKLFAVERAGLSLPQNK